MEQPTPAVRPYEVLMLGLSVYVLAALAADVALPLSPATRAVLQAADTGICVIFLADFFVRLVKAKDRKAFMKWGWIDLVASIPLVDATRVGQSVRAVRMLRVLRGVRSIKRITAFLLHRRAEAALSAAALISILLVVFAGIAILELEGRHDGATIRTPADALWWAITTVTTVGYGDLYPVTTEGRLVATLLMTTGVACFGTFTAFVASWFLAPPRGQADELSHVRAQLDLVLRGMDALRASPARAEDGTLPAGYGTRAAPPN